ncbi:unnamed protein product [Prorocentrum cordatum]|uniref:Uncharacterized protein n=1 Tax=Prorocentrum cordatum TaxID=2364126 RepID=A0ABN9RLI9_9DINO|nr:unnamed protein product [Polarella glacialis]|mmetsp:Transcript_96074/g.260853  ORF Transcript_96074/g.260853 Transcript_96074/m.260853 type:complete len:407 (+) Transcript_96074:44-1264(+)
MVAPAFSQLVGTPTVGGELGSWGPCAKGGALGSLIGSCLACAFVSQLWAGQQKRVDEIVWGLSSNCPETLRDPAAPLSELLRCEGEADRAKSRARLAFLRRTREGQEAAHAAEVDAAQSAINDLQDNSHVYSMVGSWNDWKAPETMDKDIGVQLVSSGVGVDAASVSASLWKFPITIQAPSGSASDKERTEEFQILVDGDGWENVRWRLFPSSKDNASWLLQPGGAASGAGVASAVGETAHGRNWKVQGFPGDSLLVTYNSVSREVSCDVVTTKLSTTISVTTHTTTVTLAKQTQGALATSVAAKEEERGASTGSKDDRSVDPDFGSSDQAIATCHDALEGEACWVNVMWAKTDGIDRHPEWYEGLSASSSMAEFQAMLHSRGLGDCEAPCHSKEHKLPTPFLVES